MRINCGPTYAEKFEMWERWHRWFAWRPVRVGHGDCRWLEFVERKCKFHAAGLDCWWTYEYRSLVD